MKLTWVLECLKRPQASPLVAEMEARACRYSHKDTEGGLGLELCLLGCVVLLRIQMETTILSC